MPPNARGRPRHRAALNVPPPPADTNAEHSLTPAAVVELLALSDERDAWHRLTWQMWRDGYAAAAADRADDYSRGYTDGVLARKHAEHEAVEYARVYATRWGPAGRGHFADPRPGDYPGQAGREAS